MKITRKEIIEQVKTYMEELTPQWDGTIEQTEGVSIEHYIDAVIDEQLRLLLLSAPIKLLPVTELKNVVFIQSHEDGSGQIQLPTTFLRPILLRMQGWERPVTEFIDTTHPLYPLQFNHHTRGGTAKPIAVWSVNDSGTNTIDYYSLPSTYQEHTIDTLLSVCNPDKNTSDYELHPLLIDMLCYRCGACVYDIMGNHSMAEILSARYTV